MGSQDNVIGTQQGIFEVLYECNFKRSDGHKLFHVKCLECGWESDMRLKEMIRPKICKHRNIAGGYVTKTSWKNERICIIFRGMKQRCYNPNEKSYKWYGAKGIKICDEWLKNPLSFEEWALSNGYQDDLTIDRIDSTRYYCPDNCRWVKLAENSKRAGKVNWLEVNGKMLTGRDWAKILGLGEQRINVYLRKYPEDKVKQLITAMLNNKQPIQNKQRKLQQSWFDIYGIATK